MKKVYLIASLTGVLLAIIAISFIVLEVSGGFGARPCMDSDANCQIARSQLIAGTIGIAMSAIGTFALVVTIYLSQQATKAAVIAAEAANLAVQVTREASVRELRPYLIFSRYTFSPVKNADGSITHWSVAIWWKNTGISIASHTRGMTTHLLQPGSLPQNFDFPDRAKSMEGGAIYGHGAEFYHETALIPQADIQRALDGQATLYVWSWVEYQGPGEGEAYRTEFACYLGFWDGPATNKDLASHLFFIGRFNAADHHCFRPIGARARLLSQA